MRAPTAVVFAALLAACRSSEADPNLATHEEVHKRVSPAIVSIEAVSKKDGRDMSWFGTGTIISPDGVVLTSTTVCPADATRVWIRFQGGKRIEAKFVAGSDRLEVAMIRLPDGKYPCVPMGDSSRLKLGHVVYTFGNCRSEALGGAENAPIEGSGVVARPRKERGAFLRLVGERLDRHEGQFPCRIEGIGLETGLQDHVGDEGEALEEAISEQGGADTDEGGPGFDGAGEADGVAGIGVAPRVQVGAAAKQKLGPQRGESESILGIVGRTRGDQPCDGARSDPGDGLDDERHAA